MLRVLRYLCLIAPLVWGALWIANHPGQLSVEWLGYHIETSLGVFLAALALILIAIILLVVLINMLLGAPKNIRTKHHSKRQQQGLTALTQAMAALAISDLRAADKHIRKASDLLDHAPITNLLTAQLSHAKGDLVNARKSMALMLESPETRPVALRGMIEQSVAEKHYDQAIAHALDAWDHQPNDRWLALVLIDLYSRQSQWGKAIDITQKAARKEAITRNDARRYEAIMHYENALEAAANKQAQKARKFTDLARKNNPAFVPAWLLAVDLLMEANETNQAFKLMRQCWQESPQPQWVDTLLELYHHERPDALQKRFEKLISLNPEHPESHIAMARCAMKHKQWHDARSHLKSALARLESPRIYQLLSHVELAESGNEKQANEWLTLAVASPKDASWHCSRCNHPADAWELHCSACGSFDSYVWQQAGASTQEALTAH